MKKTLLGMVAWGAAALLSLGAPEEQDEVEKGLRDAYKLYQEKKFGEVSAKLREVLKLVDEKETTQVGGILPGMLEDWESDALKREDLSLLGGGFSLQRNYFWGVKKVDIKLVKDSPLLETVMKLLQNEDLVALSGRKTHTIFGEKAVMESERKLQMVIDGRILLEVSGNEHCDESDVVGLARMLDVKRLKEMK